MVGLNSGLGNEGAGFRCVSRGGTHRRQHTGEQMDGGTGRQSRDIWWADGKWQVWGNEGTNMARER